MPSFLDGDRQRGRRRPGDCHPSRRGIGIGWSVYPDTWFSLILVRQQAGMSIQPLPSQFLTQLRELEASYVRESDPIRQSGFAGGSERWRLEREPILEPIREDGEILDIGCANGYLLECLVAWARERGISLTPFGVDQGSRLIALARRRLAEYADHFYVGNAWDWEPPKRYRYVYSVHDCVPEQFLASFVERLLGSIVAPGGILIIGAYGSHSRGIEPLELKQWLIAHGFTPMGGVTVGQPPISRFVGLAA
jgi:SAM-dependent methyltransferase